jgi:type II secretory ATPase GspE/PulE/Tfp pilus assembly ATPase PilB-like protein
LSITEEMRDLIISNPSISALRQLALQNGMVTLAHDGFRKVREGITTIEEVLSIVGDLGGGLPETATETRTSPSVTF